MPRHTCHSRGSHLSFLLRLLRHLRGARMKAGCHAEGAHYGVGGLPVAQWIVQPHLLRLLLLPFQAAQLMAALPQLLCNRHVEKDECHNAGHKDEAERDSVVDADLSLGARANEN